jgi:hypothetical protein
MADPPHPNPASALLDWTTVMEHALEETRARLKAVGIDPKAVSPAAASLRPGGAGATLRRLVRLGNRTDDALALILGYHADFAGQLSAIGVPPTALGKKTMSEVVVLLEDWARSRDIEYAKYTPGRLVESVGLDRQFIGFLVERVIVFDPEIAAWLGGLAALAAQPINALARQGKAALLNGKRTLIQLPQGMVEPPRQGINVETFVGNQWQRFWDVIWYSPHIPLVGPPIPAGYHWPGRAEIKTGRLETEQFKNEPRRLDEAALVRWQDGKTGERFETTPDLIFPYPGPGSRSLVVGRMPEKYHGEGIDIRKLSGGGEYALYDARLQMPWLRGIVRLLKE